MIPITGVLSYRGYKGAPTRGPHEPIAGPPFTNEGPLPGGETPKQGPQGGREGAPYRAPKEAMDGRDNSASFLCSFETLNGDSRKRQTHSERQRYQEIGRQRDAVK